VAALITQATGVTPELVDGKRGEFTVWVNGDVVARKDSSGFPDDDDVVAAVRRSLG
jgi:hypothetical protein